MVSNYLLGNVVTSMHLLEFTIFSMKITLGMIRLIVSCRLLAYEMFPFFVSFQVFIMVF